MDFKDALLSVYKSRPCQVIPNAFWKTERLIDSLESDFTKDGKVMELWLGDKTNLHIYWSRDRNELDLEDDYLRNLKFALIHQDYINRILLEDFSEVQRYFRIYRDMTEIPKIQMPEGFKIMDVDAENEADKVSKLIYRCYDNIKPGEEEVLSWTDHLVFDENLWVWIRDMKEEQYAGLGIAEIDKTVPEASLEWIQVAPEYHGKGLGKLIVYELLDRVNERVEFVTVSGEFDSENNPKGFYESCGFVGNDIWYVLR